MVPLKVFDVSKIHKTKHEAPIFLTLCQKLKPACNLFILITELGFIAISCMADRKGITGCHNIQPFPADSILCHPTTLERLHHFFCMASLMTTFSTWTSAYIYFKRAFSASSSFMRVIMETSIPPNFARHL